MTVKLDPYKFETDESKSNPLVVAVRHPDCKINEICAYIGVGFGSVLRQCQYLKAEQDSKIAECLYEAM